MKKTRNAKLKINREFTKENRGRPKFNLPVVKCSCGAKILLVPDLAAMDKAIKNHMAKHRGTDKQFLIEQILAEASNQTQS